MKIGIVAGESSGDLLGADLIASLATLYPNATFSGICGPGMQAAGGLSLAPMERLSIVGFDGLLTSVSSILAIRRKLLRHFLADPPDLFIGIDAPDFNLGLEKILRKAGIPTVHYVSPTIWAWRGYRIHKIRRAVDLMLAMFPFEVPYYETRGVNVRFVGHPLTRRLHPGISNDDLRARLGLADERLVAVLPGSRGREVARLGPLFIEVVRRLHAAFSNLHFVAPMAGRELKSRFQAMLTPSDSKFLTLVDGDSHAALAAAELALLASGTASLEAALTATPMVVAYRSTPFTYWLASRIASVDHAAMPNILLSREVAPEFLQHRATPDALYVAMCRYLQDPGLVQTAAAALAEIHPLLTPPGPHSAAKAIREYLSA